MSWMMLKGKPSSGREHRSWAFRNVVHFFCSTRSPPLSPCKQLVMTVTGDSVIYRMTYDERFLRCFRFVEATEADAKRWSTDRSGRRVAEKVQGTPRWGGGGATGEQKLLTPLWPQTCFSGGSGCGCGWAMPWPQSHLWTTNQDKSKLSLWGATPSLSKNAQCQQNLFITLLWV